MIDILYFLDVITKNLKYNLNFEDINIDSNKNAHDIYNDINSIIIPQGYTLINWYSSSNNYNLYIIKTGDVETLIRLGNTLNIRFDDTFE